MTADAQFAGNAERADTGALKAEVRSPFQKPAFRAIAVSVFDSDGDGVADTVRLTGKKGKT